MKKLIIFIAFLTAGMDINAQPDTAIWCKWRDYIDTIFNADYQNTVYKTKMDYSYCDTLCGSNDIIANIPDSSTAIKKFFFWIVVVDSLVTVQDVDSMVTWANGYYTPWKMEFCYGMEFIPASELTIYPDTATGIYPKHDNEEINVVIKSNTQNTGLSGNPIIINYGAVSGLNPLGGLVLAHETGHDFNLQHNSDANNVMYPSGGWENKSFNSIQAGIMHCYSLTQKPVSITSPPSWLGYGQSVCNLPQGAPHARFYISTNGGCAPLTVDFTDDSSLEPTGWLWDFGDGNSDAAQNPSHTYTTPGTYTVSLTVSNAYGAHTKTKNNEIVVNGNSSVLPVYESFEDTIFPPVNWYLNSIRHVTYFNSNNPPDIPNGKYGYAWGRTTSAAGNADSAEAVVGYYRYYSMYLTVGSGTKDALSTSLYNFQNTIAPYMTFDISYNFDYNTNAIFKDTFNIYYSIDCGKTYTSFYTKTMFDLMTNNDTMPYYACAFIPVNEYEWRKDTIDLSFLKGMDNVNFKFEFVQGRYPLFLYLDNINITDKSTGILEFKEQSLKLKVYPNPFNGSATIEVYGLYETLSPNGRSIIIYDITGRKLKTWHLKKGQSAITIKSEDIGTGLFFVTLVSEGAVVAKEKIVIHK